MSAKDQDLFHELAQALRPALSLDEVRQPPFVSLELAKYAIHRHRVGPLLHLAIHRSSDIRVDASAQSLLEASAKKNALSDLRQQAVLRILEDLFQARGIAASFIKGRGLSKQLYGEQPVRVAKDIDVLVEQSQFRAAVDALDEFGFIHCSRNLSGGKWGAAARKSASARIFKDIKFVDPTGSISLELHRRLFRFEPRGFTEQFSRAVGWSETPQITEPSYCLYLILHGSMSLWQRLKWLADLSLLTRRMADSQIQNTMRLASQFGCTDAIVSAVFLASEVFPGALPDRWMAILGEHCSNEPTVNLVEHYRNTLLASEVQRLDLPPRDFHPSGAADLIFPGRIGLVPSAVNRLLGSLSVRV